MPVFYTKLQGCGMKFFVPGPESVTIQHRISQKMNIDEPDPFSRKLVYHYEIQVFLEINDLRGIKGLHEVQDLTTVYNFSARQLANNEGMTCHVSRKEKLFKMRKSLSEMLYPDRGIDEHHY